MLHVSKLLVSSSGRQLYMKYGTLCMHRCEQSGGLECVQDHPIHQTAHTDACVAYHTVYTTVCLRMNPHHPCIQHTDIQVFSKD